MKSIVKHLNNENVKKAIMVRNLIKQIIRQFMSNEDFIEIDTPILGPQIPEYTNTQYKVNSKEKVYYLPQSPQIYKQILMNAGYTKYFQFAHCFRNGELKDNEHISEFMQLDAEMHVSDKVIIMQLIERAINEICNCLGLACTTPFPVISGTECYKQYCTDRPDFRKNSEDMSFIWIVNLPLLERVNNFGRAKVVSANINIDGEAYILSHHAFALPLNWEKIINKNDLLNILTDSFDLIVNGIEVCSGDIRINDREMQKEIFSELNINEHLYKEYLNLLNPLIKNGGFGLGIERLIMALTKNKNISEMNAFFNDWYLEEDNYE